MEVMKVKDAQAMSEEAARRIVDHVNTVEKPVLGLATGSTPEGMYQQLIKHYKENNVSFQHTATFNLDEYVGLSEDNTNSYHYYMQEKLFRHIDIPTQQTHLPSGEARDVSEACRDYESKIQAAGKMGIQVLGIGLNGHIGFNEPGTSFNSRTHVVDLDESTREANARFFNSIEDVPTQAITMGIETIMESKQIILLISGEKKKKAAARLLNGEVSESFPASVLQQHNNVIIIADEPALQDVSLK